MFVSRWYLVAAVEMPQAEIGRGTSLRLRISIVSVFSSTLPSPTLLCACTLLPLRAFGILTCPKTSVWYYLICRQQERL
jgi:hypothetical protein